MKTKILALAIAAFASMPAAAQFYVGGGVGQSNTSGLTGTTAVTATSNITVTGNSSATSWKVYGGYQFTPNWGIEGQYSNLGKLNGTATLSGVLVGSGTLGITPSQWSIAGTGTMPFGGNFYGFGKLGVSSNRPGNVSVTAGTTTVSFGTSNKTDLLAGVGVGYNINKQVGVRFEYENFGKMSSNGGMNGASIKADNWAVSLKYSF